MKNAKKAYIYNFGNYILKILENLVMLEFGVGCILSI